ncbi:hypothetical protein ACHAXN_009478 [Cyclotella atomus]
MLVAKLTASDGSAYDRFGLSVAIFGTILVVGASGDDSGKGSAYIYLYNETSYASEEVAKSVSHVDNSEYGASVAISGTTVVVGAPFENDGKGSAYVYQYNETSALWDLATSLSGDCIRQWGCSQFGSSVAISGTTVVVGAPSEYSRGSAYVYQYNETSALWDLATLLTAPHGPCPGWTCGQFGSSVAISGTTVVVGDPWAGSAYVYHKTSSRYWSNVKKMAPELSNYGGFGSSVAISGTTVVVGDYVANSNMGGPYVYHYKENGWNKVANLQAPTQGFGIPVAVSGEVVGVVPPLWLKYDSANAPKNK